MSARMQILIHLGSMTFKYNVWSFPLLGFYNTVQIIGQDPNPSLYLLLWTTLEKEMATHSSVLAWRIPGTVELRGLPSMESHRVGHD